MNNRYISKQLRQAVAVRAFRRCEYCTAQSEYAYHTFTVDHIQPLASGGSNTLDNLAYACRHCNSCKRDQISHLDPTTGIVASLFHPRYELWETHFAWSSDQTIIVGLTATGRATVDALQMNRKAAVNMRLLLIRSNLHPPE